MAVRLFEPIDRADVRMVQRGEHPRFALEAREPIRIARHVARQNLDRDVPPELRVASPVHLPHAARAEQRLQVISAQGVTAHGGGRISDAMCGRRTRRRVEQPVGGHRFVQQRFDLAPQRLVVATAVGEKCRPFTRGRASAA